MLTRIELLAIYHIDIYCHSIFALNYIFYHQIIHPQLHKVCLTIAFDPFSPNIILNTFTFLSSILLGTHILVKGS